MCRAIQVDFLACPTRAGGLRTMVPINTLFFSSLVCVCVGGGGTQLESEFNREKIKTTTSSEIEQTICVKK